MTTKIYGIYWPLSGQIQQERTHCEAALQCTYRYSGKEFNQYSDWLDSGPMVVFSDNNGEIWRYQNSGEEVGK